MQKLACSRQIYRRKWSGEIAGNRESSRFRAARRGSKGHVDRTACTGRERAHAVIRLRKVAGEINSGQRICGLARIGDRDRLGRRCGTNHYGS